MLPPSFRTRDPQQVRLANGQSVYLDSDAYEGRLERLRATPLDEMDADQRAEVGAFELHERNRLAMVAAADADRPGAAERVDNDVAGYGQAAPQQQAGVPFGDGQHRAGYDQQRDALRDRARRTLDGLHNRGLPSHAAEVAERVTRAADSAERTLANRWVTVAGSEAYESAFWRVLRDPETGYSEFDHAERAAWREGREIARALGLATGGGNAMVPVLIDPSIMLSNAGSNNPLRQVARVEQIVTSAWNGVASAGATSEWVDEAAEVADGSPTLTAPQVVPKKGDSFVPFSFEWEQDATAGMAELQRILTDSASLLQSVAFTVGTAATQPTGLLTVGTASQVSTGGTLSAANVISTQNALPPRFSANASWLANIAVINAIGQFVTPNGNLVFPESRESPATLLHKPLNELSDMGSDVLTTGAKILAYGSFRDAFIIVDRIGSSMQIVPFLFGATRRPTGQRGALLWFRTGSGVLLPNAMRVLVKS
jgi:HK97 family phage major capsid protein